MTGKLRWLTAALFVLLYVAIPSPLDSPNGRPYLTQLQVREWLLDEAASPLAAFVRDGALPALQIDLRTSPPIVDPTARSRAAAQYEACAREWVAARNAAAVPFRYGDDGPEIRPPLRLDERTIPLPMVVWVGDTGAKAQLPPDPKGRPLEHTAAFYSRLSLLPAFLAILIAVLTQRVLPALVTGGLAGAIAYVATLGPAAGTLGGFGAASQGLHHFAVGTLWDRVLWDDFNLRVSGFVICLFMAIGVMTRSGGIQGMVDWIRRYAKGPVSSQLCSYLIGLSIFFDDYSNCIIAGTTMQPVTDRARVAREKLAYIVDSTAAPIAGLSIFSTWIAYEVSQYRAPLTMVTKADGTPYLASDAFAVFVDTIPYRFYCILTLVMVLLVILMRRDFGPMLAAERRARLEGKPIADDARPMVSHSMASTQPKPETPLRGWNALLPLLVLVLGTIGIMFYQGASTDAPKPTDIQGLAAEIRWLLANAKSEWALLLASAGALVVASALALGQRLMSLGEVLRCALQSLRALGFALLILLLAWSLGKVCKDLGTSFFLTGACRDLMSAQVLPIVLFFTSALIAFATGTSYGTMAILLPNVVVLAHQIGSDAAFGGSAASGGPLLMVLTIGAVLEGSIFGDHCSPISDTTVLSSLGSRCDHLAHVATQMPYALVVMATSAVCGYLPMVLFGPQWWPLALVASTLVLAGFLWFVGKDPNRPAA
jgi:Na+/H+ antiporter NhaC